MKWQRTEKQLWECPPYYIRADPHPSGKGWRFALGKGVHFLGGFDTADEAKKAAERYEAHREQ